MSLTRSAPACIALFAALGCSAEEISSSGQSLENYQERTMRIRIDIEGSPSVTGMLEDSPAGRDFASLLPLSLTLNDYASTEKISDLPRRLAIEGEPAGTTPKAGDLAYYAPWGNLAIFYKDFRYSTGLVRLGALDADLAPLRKDNSLKVTIQKDGP